MTAEKDKQTNVFTTLQNSFYDLGRKHDQMLDAEKHLAKARVDFEAHRIEMKTIYTQAAEAAIALNLDLPRIYMEGEALVEFDKDYDARVTHVPHSGTWSLLRLVEVTSEKPVLEE